jgi:hypothetical protein
VRSDATNEQDRFEPGSERSDRGSTTLLSEQGASGATVVRQLCCRNRERAERPWFDNSVVGTGSERSDRGSTTLLSEQGASGATVVRQLCCRNRERAERPWFDNSVVGTGSERSDRGSTTLLSEQGASGATVVRGPRPTLDGRVRSELHRRGVTPREAPCAHVYQNPTGTTVVQSSHSTRTDTAATDSLALGRGH